MALCRARSFRSPSHPWQLLSVGAIILVGIILASVRISSEIRKSWSDSVPPAATQEGGSMARERIHAPELEGGFEWLNTDAPLSIAGLKGKIILLDFWTYCCINCMHVIPELKKLEAKYPNQLVVIGVHSAKFPNERDSENIRQAILRYEIEHPVVNDREFRIWRKYGPRSWPTLVVIDPDGYIVGGISGEGHYDTLDDVISQLIIDFRSRERLNEEPLRLSLEKARASSLALSFPGKVLADPHRDRLFIADSNHNRIVVTTKGGKTLDVAGTGEIGAEDGAFSSATFKHPQGMALDGDILYVADTENHLLRRLDLGTKTVTTIAGNRTQALGQYRRGPAREVALSSPWDLVLEKGILYIAMAGPHQIWAMNLQHEEIGPYAGSSHEGRMDGPLMEAALAQPSGLASDGVNLYVADSEVSAIRCVSLNPRGNVSTIVGLDLFEFGDVDGQGDLVRLQHPLGIALYNNILYVADTYNHKIKVIGPVLHTASTYLGTGKPGLRDGKVAQFYEPSGVSIANGKMYIADTNNHVIRVADLHTKEVTTLQITGLPEHTPLAMAEFWPHLEEVRLPKRTLKLGSGQLIVNVQIPLPFKLNPGSPLDYRVDIKGSISHHGERTTVKDARFPLHLPLTFTNAEDAEVHATMSLVYCREGNEGVCVMKSFRWIAPIQVTPEGDTELLIDHVLIPELPEAALTM